MDATDSTESSSLSPTETVGTIVGIACIATILILFVLLSLMACKYFLFKRARRHAQSNIARSSGSFSRGGGRDHFAMGPTGGYSKKNDYGHSKSTTESSTPARYSEEDIRLQRRRTYIGTRQFPRESLVLLNQLGDGEYGPIYQGEAYGLVPREKSRIVTVKMLKSNSKEARTTFEQEVTLFATLNHLNVAGVLAVCTDTSPECLLLDAGPTHVDLLAYIRDKGREMLSVTDGPKIVEEFKDLLRMSDEVCLGMAYLRSQNIVHKDLALRNCILGLNRVVKITSFGLGRQFYPEAYHFIHGKNLSIRWMSPEAITSGTFTEQSDVWAFGVLVWELFSYGDLPFIGKSDEQVVRHAQVEEGEGLTRPDKCPDDVFLMMSSCWEYEALSRPTFLALHEHIFELISPEMVEDHGN